jgi:DNA-binding response OmpR family regulator
MIEPLVAVISTDRTLREGLGGQVRQAGMRAVFQEEAQDLLGMAGGNREALRAVLLDLDGQGLDEGFFRSLRTALPDTRVILVSAETLHPELREALATVVLACMAKPPDPVELAYWLRTLGDD